MSRKNEQVSANEVSNIEMAATMQPEPVNAIDEATKAIEALKAQMAEAKRKLAEAKKASTKSRPVRMSTFVTYVCPDKASKGVELTKTDVHYCAEKAAIDALSEDLKNGRTNTDVYKICKRLKADEDNELVVEMLWIDEETRQIVIE